jgi:hypothetical protein
MYFTVLDPVTEIGGWFRFGDRPNKAFAEMSASLNLTIGRVSFMYGWPTGADQIG